MEVIKIANNCKSQGKVKPHINVIVVNKPTGNETEEKLKKLSEFLSSTWITHEKSE